MKKQMVALMMALILLVNVLPIVSFAATHPYVPVVEQEIEDVSETVIDDEEYLNSPWIANGQLWDIDGDGVQELIVSSQYIFSPGEREDVSYLFQHTYSIYDIDNNVVQTIVRKEPLAGVAAGTYGYAGVVIYNGSPVVMTCSQAQETSRFPGTKYYQGHFTVTLYDGINHKSFRTIEIETTNTEMSCFINGAEVTLDAFRKEMANYTYLELKEEAGEFAYTNPVMPLPELLTHLKNSPIEDNKPGTPPVSGNPFVDVATKDYYFEPVQWAVKNGITNGMDATHFAPDGTCTRAQIVTFLWRANGSPKPSSSKNPFRDVPAGQWYTDAVLWAVEKGITTGTSATTFSPDAGCTRGQVATFLWRSQKQPASGGNNIFTDIVSGTYYYNAVLWAVENGITNGMGDGTFAPDATCTRGQIVTFLYRAMSQPNKELTDFTIHWLDIIAGSTYDSNRNLTGFLLEAMFHCDPDIREGFTADNSFGAKGGHKPFYVNGQGCEYMYFSFWLPNDPSLQGKWHTLSLDLNGKTERVRVKLEYLGDYSHIVGTPNSVNGLGWTVSDWEPIA